MLKKFLIPVSLALFAGSLMAADAQGNYQKRGETAGMDPQKQDGGQKVTPKTGPAKNSTGTKPVQAAKPGAPEPLKGMAAREETAGMDPKNPEGGQKAVEKKKKQ